ncbi:hypothetical protein Tco_0882207 [Tanacetum coccineum]
MVGSLMYLTASRPDLVFVVCMCARYHASPTKKYLEALKWIFWYLRGTINWGLWYPKDTAMALTAYANADHAVRLMHERNPDPLALVASHHLTQPAYQSHLHTHPQSLSQHHVSPYQSSQFVTPYQHQQFSTNQSTPLSITYPTNEYQSTVHHNSYSQQPSIPQLEYAPTTYQQQQPEFSQPDSSLVVPVFQKGDDPIDAINHMMSFLTAVVTSRYPTTNNQLRTSSNPRQQATIYDGKVTVQPVQGRQTTYAAGTTRKFTPGASGSNTGKQRTVIVLQ